MLKVYQISEKLQLCLINCFVACLFIPKSLGNLHEYLIWSEVTEIQNPE